jgi:cytochrome c553
VRSTASLTRSSLAVFTGLLLSAQVLSADKTETCLACHGANGTSQTPLTPSLGGQPAFYIAAQLFLFRGGRRDNEVMTAQAKDLSDDDLRTLSDRISKLPAPKSSDGKPDAGRVSAGKSSMEKNNCAGCHGKQYDGNNNVPHIANQREDYLLKALKDYKSGKRIGYGNAVMPETLGGLSEAELADVAHALAHFGN